MAIAVFVAVVASPVGHAADRKCQIGRVAELPITMDSLRPVIPAKINGQDAKFILDSGAFYSMISSATAEEYKLRLSPGPFGLTLNGVGGYADVHVATAKEFSIVGVTLKNVEFLVGGSEVGSDGLLGQNLLEQFDVEYDLANGAIRLFRTKNCGNVRLAYWLTPGQPFSQMDIERIEPSHPFTIGVAYVNGQKIRVTFDTGAFTSILSLRAAERAGIKPDSPGVVDGGYSRGIGRGTVKSYVATFASFKIGDSEEIKNAKLRFAEINFDTDMLLGADFFVSHRIFVGNAEHRLFLSYNGGPVFNLSKSMQRESSGDARRDSDGGDSRPDATLQAGTPQASQVGTTVTDSAELARRGSALAARRDFVPALADLTKAIELSPNEPEYYFQRANAYLANKQLDPALADFDHAILLKQDFIPAYILRAEIKLWKKEQPAAIEDLETVDRLAPKQADLRFRLGELYERIDRLPAAIEQLGFWIQFHPDDARMGQATSARCFSSALQNQDLSTALGDCNTALRRSDKHNPNYSYVYANRALVRLRQGDLDKAIADCNDALKIMPKNARALYIRAVAEARHNPKRDSKADLQAATEIEPQLAERFARHGIGVQPAGA